MNRVAITIDKQRIAIAEKLAAGEITQEKIDKAHKDCDLTFDEFVRFQELKSLASTDDTLSLEEAQLVYTYLGETPDHFNRQSIEVKAVLTDLFAGLLKRRIIATARVRRA